MESVLNDTEKVRYHTSLNPRFCLPFTNLTYDVQRFILAEMIKLSDVDVGVLIHLVKSHDIQPKWMFMQLPGGKRYCDCHVEIPTQLGNENGPFLTCHRRAQHESMSPCRRGHVQHADAAALDITAKAAVTGRTFRLRSQQKAGSCVPGRGVAARVSAGTQQPACSRDAASEHPTTS